MNPYDCRPSCLHLDPSMSWRPPTEYYLLADAKPEGDVIGYLAGHPITEMVVDRNGVRYHFVGVAPRASGSRFDLTSLRPGEWIVLPGLIYSVRKQKPGHSAK